MWSAFVFQSEDDNFFILSEANVAPFQGYILVPERQAFGRKF